MLFICERIYIFPPGTMRARSKVWVRCSCTSHLLHRERAHLIASVMGNDLAAALRSKMQWKEMTAYIYICSYESAAASGVCATIGK